MNNTPSAIDGGLRMKRTHALTFKIVAQCTTSKARVAVMTLPHGPVDTPVFMPVATQGTLKGLLPQQLDELGYQIMLGNTYHLGTRPGQEIMKKAGGLHTFSGWGRNLLTDSGGFQMVSLVKLSEVTEAGVKFQSPYNEQAEILLTPEKSIEIQEDIGADIIMQLDDVVSSTVTGPRVEEAMRRSIRWLDRCLAAQTKASTQSLFPIIQGGLDKQLRRECATEMIKRDVAGFAIGGLSGGESKEEFWKMVLLSTLSLPADKPRYLMGVGFALDLVVCCALGVDMFDCVFPTRTARFGSALIPSGSLQLKQKRFAEDLAPIDSSCTCSTCQTYTRAFLHKTVTRDTVACHLLTVHNLAYQMKLMKSIRQSIVDGKFPTFVDSFLSQLYPNGDIPQWAIDALRTVNLNVNRTP